MEILAASANPGKIREIKETAINFRSLRIISPYELADSRGGIPEVDEHGDSYMANARLKAKAFLKWGSYPALADDSGLEVQALNGKPGVCSSRYAGEDADSTENISKLLAELRSASSRKARFFCQLYLMFSEKDFIEVSSELRGEIILSPRGAGGFGYDPAFVPEGHRLTLAELKERGIPVKTHRILALEKLFAKLQRHI